MNLLESQELASKTVADLNQENIARIFSLLKTVSVENYIPDSSLNERINNAFFEYINGKYTQDTYNRLNNLVEKQIKKLIKKSLFMKIKYCKEIMLMNLESKDNYYLPIFINLKRILLKQRWKIIMMKKIS